MSNVVRYGRPYPPMTDRPDEGRCCKAAARGGWLCTRPDGHDGRHEAGNAAGHMFASWEDEPLRAAAALDDDDAPPNAGSAS